MKRWLSMQIVEFLHNTRYYGIPKFYLLLFACEIVHAK